MSVLNPLTIILEFVPPLVVTLAYLLAFRGRRNRFVEAFIALMFIKTVTFFLFGIWYNEPDPSVAGGFDPTVNSNTFYWLLIADFFFQFSYSLQEILTWIMLSFIAVLFGMVVLALKMALQDPLKMRFRNVIKRITGSPPETDGYSGFRDRLDHLSFEGVDPQPLDPEVQSRAWSEAWRDYLIIGLATLLPSIPLYIGSLESYVTRIVNPMAYVPPNSYIIGVLIFLTWIYRFAYPASNRIAKGAGLKLGDRDVGSEMMQGVLGWFFRLNILLTLYFLASDILRGLRTGTLGYLGAYYVEGIFSAAPAILFAIIVLPLAERFAVVLYKKVFDRLNNFRQKISGIGWRKALANAAGAIGTGGLVSGLFVGAIMGVTLHTAFQMGIGIRFLPGAIDDIVAGRLFGPVNNTQTLLPGFWTLLVFSIPLATMLLNGVVGHYVRDRIGGGMEAFAFISGLVVSVATYFAMPGLDYIVGGLTNEVQLAGLSFARFRPVLVIPGTTPEEYLYRLAFQFIVNIPIYISVSLFVLYYFEYRERWREQTGEAGGPLLNVKLPDVKHSVGMFLGGIAISAGVVFVFSLFTNPGLLGDLINGLINEIGNPDGLELVLAVTGSYFVILAEHNIVRTLLVLVIGPVFWALVLWLVAVEKPRSEENVALSAIVMTVLGAALAVVWTYHDYVTGVFIPSVAEGDPYWPFTYTAHLGLRAAIVLGAIFAVYAIVAIAKSAFGRGIGAWWFPPLLLIIGIEYFVWDDQFTLIALIVMPMILAAVYKLIFSGKEEVRREDILITYIRFSVMSLAIAEVLSTALWLGGDFTLNVLFGNPAFFLARTLPHAIVEIPAFLFAAAASIRIARDLAPTIEQENWEMIPQKTKELLTSGRLWRTFALVVFFLLVAALIETNISWIVAFLFA